MAKKFKNNLGGVKNRKSESRVSAERVMWETQNRFNPIRNLSPASLSSNMDAWERGEISNLARIWDVMARRDLRLAGIIPKRLKKPGRRDWNIVMHEEGPAAEAQRDIVEHALNHCVLKSAVDGDKLEGFAGIIRSMMNAVGMKYAVHELIWQPDAHGLTFEAVEVPLWFFERKSGKLRYLAQPNSLTGEDIEPGEWMVTVADGLMESSGIAYMFKSLPLKDILAFCDKFGVPGLIAKTDASPDTKEWEAVHEMVASFGSEMAAVVSRNGTELEFPTVKSSTGTTPMEALVEYIDRAMAAVWHGSDLSTMSREESVGSLAQNAEADTLELDDCKKISDTINKQLISYIVKYALGTDEVLVKFELDVSDLESTGDELTVDKGLYEMGFKHSVNDLAERYGRKVPEDDEETLSQDKGERSKDKVVDAELANVAGGDHHINQGRDAKGRFGSNKSSASDSALTSSGNALMKMLKDNGGFTVNLDGSTQMTGYVVAVDKNTERIYDELTEENLDAYIDEFWDDLNTDNRKLGGWLNTEDGKVYLDVPIVVADYEEALDLSLEHEQIAFFHLDTFTEHNTTKSQQEQNNENTIKKTDLENERRSDDLGPEGRDERRFQTPSERELSQARTARSRGFLSRFLAFFANKDPGLNPVESAVDDALENAQAAMQKDFQPMAQDIAAALNETDPALRKALLLRIAESPVPESPELEEAIVRGMAAEVVNGFASVK